MDYELDVINPDDPELQMITLEKRIVCILKNKLNKLLGVKYDIYLTIEITKNGKVDEVNFRSHSRGLIDKDKISKTLSKHRNQILQEIDSYTMNGSGWTANRIVGHTLHIRQYKPLKGKSCI